MSASEGSIWLDMINAFLGLRHSLGVFYGREGPAVRLAKLTQSIGRFTGGVPPLRVHEVCCKSRDEID